MTHYCSLLTQWALRISQKARSLKIKPSILGQIATTPRRVRRCFPPILQKLRGASGELASILNIGLQFITLHLHHNLAKAAYRAKNYRNLVEFLLSDKADLITILVHFCYPRDWQFSDKPCRFNRFFGDSRNSVSGKSIWHHHRTR